VVDGRADLEFGGSFPTDETPFLRADHPPTGVDVRAGELPADHPSVLVEE